MYLQTLETVLSNSSKVLVDTGSSGNMMLLPLDRLTRGAAAATSPRGSIDSSSQADIQDVTNQVMQELRRTQDSNVRRSR